MVMSKVEDLLEAVRLNEIINKRKENDEKSSCVKMILIIAGIVLVAAAVAFAVYKFVTPDYLEDFDDDFDDDFDEDFFDDHDEIEVDSKDDKKQDQF